MSEQRYVSLSEQTLIVANGIAARAAFMHDNSPANLKTWLEWQNKHPSFRELAERKQYELFDLLMAR